MSDVAIKIDALHKQYGSADSPFHALKGVSFDVKQGEIFGLLGPNGAGKSTLISILGGLSKATSGRASIMGFDVHNQYREARRHIGIVPQEIAFDPFFTVKESLELQLGYMGLKLKNHTQWIDYLIDAMGLSDKANSRVKSLSGGMKRRVLIAQALVHKPPVLVLDEPTAGVDVGLRQSLWTFVRELNKEGHTIVLTTHYLEEAESLCDRIGILNHGQLTHLNTKEELIKKTAKKRLILSLPEVGSGNDIAELNAQLEGVVFKAYHQEASSHCDEVMIEFDESTYTVGQVLNAINAKGLTILDIRTEQPSLEEAFIQLTQGGES